jgi:hypothetical protein
MVALVIVSSLYFILKLFLNPETKVLFTQIGPATGGYNKSQKKNHPTLVATSKLMPSFTSREPGQAINLVFCTLKPQPSR